LVISEEDLDKAITIIEKALNDLDKVRLLLLSCCHHEKCNFDMQLEDIPGEVCAFVLHAVSYVLIIFARSTARRVIETA
jgi:hypothetical protein